MNNKLICTIAFSFGAAIGSISTWFLLKTKYEKIAQEEIDSVKEMFLEREHKSEANVVVRGKMSKEEAMKFIDELDDAMDSESKDKLKNEYNKIASGYSNYIDYKKEIENRRPYVISPEEFGDCDYETVSLTYYADKVLTDDMDEPIEDVENTVGSDSLNHFGEYEDDSVFVRNDRLKIDYEILLDLRKYSDLANTRPHLVEEE